MSRSTAPMRRMSLTLMLSITCSPSAHAGPRCRGGRRSERSASASLYPLIWHPSERREALPCPLSPCTSRPRPPGGSLDVQRAQSRPEVCVDIPSRLRPLRARSSALSAHPSSGPSDHPQGARPVPTAPTRTRQRPRWRGRRGRKRAERSNEVYDAWGRLHLSKKFPLRLLRPRQTAVSSVAQVVNSRSGAPYDKHLRRRGSLLTHVPTICQVSPAVVHAVASFVGHNRLLSIYPSVTIARWCANKPAS